MTSSPAPSVLRNTKDHRPLQHDHLHCYGTLLRRRSGINHQGAPPHEVRSYETGPQRNPILFALSANLQTTVAITISALVNNLEPLACICNENFIHTGNTRTVQLRDSPLFPYALFLSQHSIDTLSFSPSSSSSSSFLSFFFLSLSTTPPKAPA